MESNFYPEDEKQVSAENHHFDLKPSFDSDNDNEGKVKKKLVKEMRNKFYKKCIVITSRVHPGETQSSFLVEGLISYLLSDEEEAREIREKFVFKIIPMLNPDGVYLGNSRSSLMGVDLNRRWLRPSKFLHPTIYYTKSLIKYLNKKM
jgi:murein tripeptide amidase MpaA